MDKTGRWVGLDSVWSHRHILSRLAGGYWLVIGGSVTLEYLVWFQAFQSTATTAHDQRLKINGSTMLAFFGLLVLE